MTTYVSTILGVYMGPLPKVGTTRRTEVTGQGKPGEVAIPLAEIGRPIAYLVGRQRVTRPNTIWMGNVRAIIETERSSETFEEDERGPTGLGNIKITKTVTTTTYKTVGYNLSMQFAICLGPECVLKAIGVGDEILWEGTAGPARTEFTISQNTTYMAGDVIFAGGNFDQAIDPWLEPFVGAGNLPGYRGVAYIIIKDLRADQLGSTFPWFEIERFPNPLGLASGVNRIGDDINIASAMADYLGTTWGGAGAGEDAIDDTTFGLAATTLDTENNGVSFQLAEETTASAVIGALLSQADGIVYENPTNELIEFKLFRRALFNPLTALKALANNTSRIGRWDREAWPSTCNKMKITFTHRDAYYKEDSIMGYTFNAINDRFKANRSMSLDFPMVSNTTLAKSILARELGKYGVPRAVGEVELDRTRDPDVVPGDGIQVLIPDRVAPVTGFVTRVRRFSTSDNRLIVGYVEVPPQNNNVVFDAETNLGSSVRIAPTKPDDVIIDQAPYWLAKRNNSVVSSAGLASDASNGIAALFLITPADDLQYGFEAYIYDRPSDPDGTYAKIAAAPYTTRATLQTPIGQFDEMDDGILTSIIIEDVINSRFLTTEGTEAITEGRVLMFIDNEILSFTVADEDPITGEWTLENVYRGLLDTAPQAHAAGAKVFVMGNNYSIVGQQLPYPVTYTPTWRIVSTTAFAAGRPDDTDDYYGGAITWDKTYNRVSLPLRPHNTKIDAAVRSTSLVNALGLMGHIVSPSEVIDVTWATRSRSTLDVKVQLDAAQDSEIEPDGVTYQTHQVLIRDSGGTLRDCGTTLDDANYNTLAATVHASTAYGTGYLFVRSHYAAFSSRYEDQVPVYVIPTDYFVDETGDFYLESEDGNFHLIVE